MRFDKSWSKMLQNNTSNLDKVFMNMPPSSDFGLECRILQIGWFYRPKWKKVKNQRKKINIPSSSVFWFEDSKVLIRGKSDSGKPWILIMSFHRFLRHFDNAKCKTHLQSSKFLMRLSVARAYAHACIKIDILRKYELKNAKFVLLTIFMIIFWHAKVSVCAFDFRF